MKSIRFALLAVLACALSACAALTAAPPQLPAQVTAVSQTAVTVAANAFDAALYGLDAAMDAHLIVPGSAQAKQIAAVGRKVQAALNAANAALHAGNSATAAEALSNANAAISQFKALLPGHHVGLAAPPLDPLARARLLERLG